MPTLTSQMEAGLAPLRKLIVTVGLFAASPFWMVAFLLFLLEKPLLWSAILATIGALLVAGSFVAWLVVRAKVRDVTGTVDDVGAYFDVRR